MLQASIRHWQRGQLTWEKILVKRPLIALNCRISWSPTAASNDFDIPGGAHSLRQIPIPQPANAACQRTWHTIIARPSKWSGWHVTSDNCKVPFFRSDAHVRLAAIPNSCEDWRVYNVQLNVCMMKQITQNDEASVRSWWTP